MTEVAAQGAGESTGLKTVLLAAAALAILSIAAAIVSDGFIEADAATHFAYARFALHEPWVFVNIWARPLTTALFALPAAFAGRLGVRIISLACAIGCGLLAWRIAILQRYRWPALAAIFTFGQPLLFLHSFSEMTELPFALLLAAVFWAYRTERWSLFAILGALLPMGRPEGFGVVALIAAALLLHKKPWCILILPLPLVIWSYAGWIVDFRAGHWWKWLIVHWPYASMSDYQPGSFLHFVMRLPMLVSPVALPAMLIGCGLSLRARPLRDSHQSRCQFLIAAIPLTVLVIHSLLYWRGRLSSNGELRYLLIASPFWGLLSAAGWEWIWNRLHLPRPTAWAALAVVAAGAVNWQTNVVPLKMSADWQSAERLVRWYETTPMRKDYPRLVFAHPGIEYYLTEKERDSMASIVSKKSTVLDDPPGCLLVWDPGYSGMNSDPGYDVTVPEALAAGWREIPVPGRVGPGWRFFLSSQSIAPQPG